MLPKSYKSIFSMVLAVVLIMTGLMLVASGCGDEYIYDPENPDFVPPEVPTGPVSVGAAAFFGDYAISTESGDSKYANRTVEIKGCTVTSVFNDYFIVNQIGKVIPEDEDICIGLNPGDRVDVTGLVDEYSVEIGQVPILDAEVDVG